jgi:membrane protein DedA with SNARE-associated domain
LLVLLGYRAGLNWTAIAATFAQYSRWLAIVAVPLAVLVVAWWWHTRRRRRGH